MKNLIAFLLILGYVSANAQISISDTVIRAKLSILDSQIIYLLRDSHMRAVEEEGNETYDLERIESGLKFDEVKYPADSSFKIFRYTWEQQGVYSYEVDAQYIGLKDLNSQKLVLLNLPMEIRGQIDSIQKIDRGKYLLFSSHWSRDQGGGSNNHNSAYLLSIQENVEFLWSFDICTSDQDEEGILEFEYDRDSRTISYKHKFHDYNNFRRPFIKEGIWKYEDGMFKINQEKTTYLN